MHSEKVSPFCSLELGFPPLSKIICKQSSLSGVCTRSYHGAINRGSAVLTLYPFANQTDDSETAANAEADPDLKTFNLTMPNVAIPSVNVTNYMCSHVEVPVSGKQHIVR